MTEPLHTHHIGHSTIQSPEADRAAAFAQHLPLANPMPAMTPTDKPEAPTPVSAGTVKPLVWRPDGVAPSHVGSYTVWAALSGTGWRLSVPSYELNVLRFSTEDDAKAAAQADYAARILSSLEV